MSSKRRFVNVQERSDLSIARRFPVFPTVIYKSPEDSLHLSFGKSSEHAVQDPDRLIVYFLLLDSDQSFGSEGSAHANL